MRARWILIGAAICVLVFLWSFLAIRRKIGEPRDAGLGESERIQPRSVTLSRAEEDVSQLPSKPRMFKSTRYPPETDEEKAMWEWWRAMGKADPKFEWKMPIEFYGRVVDQFGDPVSDALVVITWTSRHDSRERRLNAGRDGLFAFTGEQGKHITVNIHQDGYVPTRDSFKGFEYAAFFDDSFHVPDKAKPVVFRLQKLLGAEPMLKHITTREIVVGAEPVVLNVETGELGSDGDLAFSVVTAPQRGEHGPDYQVAIRALGGSGIVENDEEFMFNAPENGYQGDAIYSNQSSNPDYSLVVPYRFYVRTRSGKFAALTGEITIYVGLSAGKAGFHAIVHHNPSGSRNLEFDHRKWINRK